MGSPDRMEVTRGHRGEDPITNPQRPVAELLASAGEGRDLVRTTVRTNLKQSQSQLVLPMFHTH